MPWITDSNGEKKYQVSIYAKEELPTWDEIYNKFYKEGITSYDPGEESHQDTDIYWKLPSRKVILATVCNQFNKMLFEDGKLQETIEYINENIMQGAIDIRFTCELIEPCDYIPQTAFDHNIERWVTKINKMYLGLATPPPVYTIPFPSGVANPFITSSISRIDISKLDEVMYLYPVILFKTEEGSKVYAPKASDKEQKDDYENIIKFMIRDIIDYSEGEAIGWKDMDGKVHSDKEINHYSRQNDPAI